MHVKEDEQVVDVARKEYKNGTPLSPISHEDLFISRIPFKKYSYIKSCLDTLSPELQRLDVDYNDYSMGM